MVDSGLNNQSVSMMRSTVPDAEREPETIVEFLQKELLRRCRKRAGYSLRAFANSLRIEPSALSKILNGKRSISPTMFSRLIEMLGLEPEQVRKFTEASRTESSPDLMHYHTLSLDSFRAISDWYHYAILELTKVKGFKGDSRWIAARLGVTVSEIQEAVGRLERLGMLEILPNGTWIDRADSVTTVGNRFTNIAFRKLQKQILEKAIQSLEEVPFQHRDHTAMTMAVSSDRIQEAKERIKKFRRSLCRFLQSGENTDAVFHLGVALYPVTPVQDRTVST